MLEREKDKALEKHIIESLNEIKRLADLLYEGSLSQDYVQDIADDIVDECDFTLEEIRAKNKLEERRII